MDKENMHSSHKGGNVDFWNGKEVNGYDINQKMIVEYKEDVLSNILRIARFFTEKNNILSPTILDIGCGPGTLSKRLLDSIGNCKVIGVDSSKQMIMLSRHRLRKFIPNRYDGCVSNFNSEDFWTSKIDQKYDFIVSSLALHYLSDERRDLFFKEIQDHINKNGVFIACIGNLSDVPEIGGMEQVFKAEYAYKNRAQKETRQENDNGNLDGFNTFLTELKERQKDMNINWRPPKDYLIALENAGFEKSEIVWHAWVKSIYVAIG